MQFSTTTLQIFADLLGQVKVSPLEKDADSIYDNLKIAREELISASKEINANSEPDKLDNTDQPE